MREGNSPINVRRINADWDRLYHSGEWLNQFERKASDVLQEHGFPPAAAPSELPDNCPEECLCAAYALQCASSIRAADGGQHALFYDKHSVGSDFARFFVNFTRMQCGPLADKLEQHVEREKKRSKGRSSGAYKCYGSKKQREAAIEDFARLREEIRKELPEITRDALCKEIARRTTFRNTDGDHPFDPKTIKRGLREWDAGDSRTTVPNRPSTVEQF